MDTSLLERAYAPLLALSSAADEEVGWTPTLLPGWCVRDLLFHLASDCQRALVALAVPSHQPNEEAPDTDDVTYWSGWQPGTQGAADGLRGVRTIASAWSSVRGPADLHLQTARAVLALAATVAPEATVATQGHRLRADHLVSTLVVEAAVHHLDLEPVLAARPDATVLGEARRVLDALLGAPAPTTWDDVRHVRLGTGRATPNAEERSWLGERVDRLPLLG